MPSSIKLEFTHYIWVIHHDDGTVSQINETLSILPEEAVQKLKHVREIGALPPIFESELELYGKHLLLHQCSIDINADVVAWPGEVTI